MANTNPWWVIWANNQPVKGVGTTGNTFQGTKAQAQAAANTTVDGSITGPYTTQALALAAIKAAGGSGSGSKVTNPPAGPQQPLSPSSLSNLLNWPTFEHLRPFMVRVSKVVIGGVLIIAGLTMLVKQETNISVGDVAKVAAVA